MADTSKRSRITANLKVVCLSLEDGISDTPSLLDVKVQTRWVSMPVLLYGSVCESEEIHLPHYEEQSTITHEPLHLFIFVRLRRSNILIGYSECDLRSILSSQFHESATTMTWYDIWNPLNNTIPGKILLRLNLSKEMRQSDVKSVASERNRIPSGIIQSDFKKPSSYFPITALPTSQALKKAHVPLESKNVMDTVNQEFEKIQVNGILKIRSMSESSKKPVQLPRKNSQSINPTNGNEGTKVTTRSSGPSSSSSTTSTKNSPKHPTVFKPATNKPIMKVPAPPIPRTNPRMGANFSIPPPQHPK